ncbi:MAG: glycosyltransferase family 9 protein [Burkholderiales bacterium]
MSHASHPTRSRPKLLAMIFMYLGDVVVTTPALRAIRRAYPDWELHVLVPGEAVPLLRHVRWIDRVWGFPRQRGRLNLSAAMPVIGALRRERFAVSLDFVGNDRGALLSLLVAAKRRIGAVAPRGFLLRSKCYTDPVEQMDATRHASIRAWAVTAPLNVPFPHDMACEIAVDPDRAEQGRAAIGDRTVLCYVTATQPKREWPLENWISLAAQLEKQSVRLAFTGGSSEREKRLLVELAGRESQLFVIPPPEPLDLLLAVIAGARLFISADTGPMHFAAGLRVPTLSLFGPTAAHCWAPIGPRHRSVQGSLCACSGHVSTCQAQVPCMSGISPGQVLEACQQLLKAD